MVKNQIKWSHGCLQPVSHYQRVVRQWWSWYFKKCRCRRCWPQWNLWCTTMENKSQGDVGQTASIYLATHVKLELCSPTSLWGTTNRTVCLQPSRASHVPWVQWIPEFVVRPLRTRCACHRFKIGLHYDYHLICHLFLAIVSHCFFVEHLQWLQQKSQEICHVLIGECGLTILNHGFHSA